MPKHALDFPGWHQYIDALWDLPANKSLCNKAPYSIGTNTYTIFLSWLPEKILQAFIPSSKLKKSPQSKICIKTWTPQRLQKKRYKTWTRISAHFLLFQVSGIFITARNIDYACQGVLMAMLSACSNCHLLYADCQWRISEQKSIQSTVSWLSGEINNCTTQNTSTSVDYQAKIKYKKNLNWRTIKFLELTFVSFCNSATLINLLYAVCIVSNSLDANRQSFLVWGIRKKRLGNLFWFPLFKFTRHLLSRIIHSNNRWMQGRKIVFLFLCLETKMSFSLHKCIDVVLY